MRTMTWIELACPRRFHPGVVETVRFSATARLLLASVVLTIGLSAQEPGLSPAVQIAHPTNASVAFTPSVVTLRAEAADPDSPIARVRFFSGALYLGSDATAPYSVSWTNPPAGGHSLVAVAEDVTGLAATSTVVSIVVQRRIVPAADAHVRNGSYAAQNFGSATNLEVQTSNKNGNSREAWLLFPLPPLAHLSQARLRFQARLTGSGSISLQLHAAPTNWTESLITWNNRPPVGPALASATLSGTTLLPVEFDITATLQAELAAGRSTVGFALRSASSSAQTALLASREIAGDSPELLLSITNSGPAVSLLLPEPAAAFDPPATVPLTALAESPDGPITQVDFLTGDSLLFTLQAPPWETLWNEAPYGPHQIIARATDTSGRTAVSTPVNILVDAAPAVTLVQPAPAQSFVAPAQIPLVADPSDADGHVVRVEFFADQAPLGIAAAPPWSLVWTNVQPGTYLLHARATDDLGRTTLSEPVLVTVHAPPAILEHPQSLLLAPGSDATFSVVATGSPPLTYQWRRNGQPLPSAHGPTLTLLHVAPADAGVYDVEVGSAQGSAFSQPARLGLSALAAWGNHLFGQSLLHPWMTNHVAAVSAGFSHNLALRGDGTVLAWGDDLFGQSTVPAGLAGVVAVSAGERHSLALREDGTVVGWGNNSLGQISIPAGLTNVVAIDAGRYHSLALTADGRVHAWGWNLFGQAAIPPGLSNIIAISSSGDHNLVLRADGTAVAWGWNEYGQTNLPAGLPPIAGVAAGMFHNLLRTSDGRVLAFGNNLSRQLNVPTNLDGVVAVAAGYSHSLALRRDGSVVHWGGDSAHQADLPPIAFTVPVLAIAAGQYHSLALFPNDGNLLPTVNWVSPAAGTTFSTPGPLNLVASARDWDDQLAGVAFYAGTELLGAVDAPPFSIAWVDPPVGSYTLRAAATDTRGARRLTGPVSLRVTAAASLLGDAHVRDGTSASANFGSAPQLEVQTGSTGNNRDAYLLFDLGDPGFFSEARFRLYGAVSGNASVTTTAYAVPDITWSESSLSWNNRPVLGTSLGSVTFSGTSPRTYEMDVSAYVRSELAAGRRRIAIALHNPAASNRYLRINSREATTNPPLLILSSSNTPPAVAWIAPADHALFRAPANIPLEVDAYDSDGTVTRVDWFADGALLGSTASAPHAFVWQQPGSGTHSVVARVFDNAGAHRTSTPKTVRVDIPPTVSLVRPADGDVSLEPATLHLEAVASDPDDAVERVEFFTGTNIVAIPGNSSATATRNQVGAGFYSIHAVAYDQHGLASTSTVAHIEVFPLAIDPGPGRLAVWRFDGPTFQGDRGQSPLAQTNAAFVPSGGGHALLLDSTAPVHLAFRDVEPDRHPNLDLQQGSLLLRINPRWASSAAGGSGPGLPASLLSIGGPADEPARDSWEVLVASDGDLLLWVSRSAGTSLTNLTVPIHWRSNQWHQLAFTWSPSHSSIQVDDSPPVLGPPVAFIPGPLDRAIGGLRLGSSSPDRAPIRALLDDLESFNYLLTPQEIAARLDSDGDSLPDPWELRYGLDPISSTGPDGAEGDPDLDGVSNRLEFLQGRNPVVPGTLPDDGRIALDLFTPLDQAP